MVRLPNPQNTLTLFFKGIVFIPTTKVYPTQQIPAKEWQKYTATNVAAIQLNLWELFKATFPQDAVSKMGGPCIGAMHVTGGPVNGEFAKDWWPNTMLPHKDRNPASFPYEWWRWALIMLYPREPTRFYAAQRPLTIEQVGGLFGGWQLFRHRKTKFRVLATKPYGYFSPVASLLSQNDYLARREGEGPPIEGNPPMCSAYISNTSSTPRKESYFATDDTRPPAKPPNFQKWPEVTGPYIVGPYKHYSVKDAKYLYSRSTWPSFATLSALGAPWSFPPGQKTITRGSFNKHTITGSGDPQGRRWMTLVPKNKEDITAQTMTGTELNTDIATLFLAQGSAEFNTYKFGTTHGEILVQRPLACTVWAVVKIESIWQLGNMRRPYPWDVSWYNQVDG